MTTLTEQAIQTYSIDPAHSRLGFTARHMGFAKVRGSFEDFEGTIHLDPSDLSTFEAEGVIRTESITTNEAKRDQHLRSEDFFHAEEYPTLTFKSTDVRDVDGDTFTVVGDLTIRDTTKQVQLDAKYLGEGTDPWGGTRIALEAKTTINRKDWGLKWNQVLETGGVLVSEDIDLSLEVQAVLQDDES